MTRVLSVGCLLVGAVLAQAAAAFQAVPPAPRPAPQPGVFPAMQRPAADPATIERGKAVFGVNCVACHGADARGGQLNGPNLLRSQLVLADQNGELILPVVRNGRPERGMPALPLAADDLTAVVEFIHSLTAASPGQGAPPRAEAPPPDIVVGDAAAGRSYFAAKCSACHSVDGDLRGVAGRVADAKALQNLWVSGGTTGRGRGGEEPSAPAIAATIALPSGERVQGRLAFIDDFEVKIVAGDGRVRSFGRSGDVPRVELRDPLEGHMTLLSELTDKDMRNVTAYLVTLK